MAEHGFTQSVLMSLRGARNLCRCKVLLGLACTLVVLAVGRAAFYCWIEAQEVQLEQPLATTLGAPEPPGAAKVALQKE